MQRQQTACQCLKQILPLHHAKVRRRCIDPGRISLGSGGTELLNGQQKPHSLAYINRPRLYLSMFKMQMIIAAGQETVDGTDWLRLLIPLLHISRLHEWPLFIEQVKGHAFLLAEGNVRLDLLHVEVSLVQKLLNIIPILWSQRIHQEHTEKPINAEFLQGRNHGYLLQLRCPPQSFPDTQKRPLTILRHNRYPWIIQHIE